MCRVCTPGNGSGESGLGLEVGLGGDFHSETGYEIISFLKFETRSPYVLQVGCEVLWL